MSSLSACAGMAAAGHVHNRCEWVRWGRYAVGDGPYSASQVASPGAESFISNPAPFVLRRSRSSLDDARLAEDARLPIDKSRLRAKRPRGG